MELTQKDIKLSQETLKERARVECRALLDGKQLRSALMTTVLAFYQCTKGHDIAVWKCRKPLQAANECVKD